MRQLFEYNDGKLIRRVSRGGNKKGTVAGSKDRDYLSVTVDEVAYKVHRVIWAIVKGEDPGELMVDHIDGNKTNNRIENLRLATNSQNQANRPLAQLYYRDSRQRWEVCVRAGGKRKYAVGKCPLLVHLKRCDLRDELHGEFAKTGT